MTAADALLPCPFCGSADIDPEGVLASKDGGKNYTYPACNDCSASCENWNTRTAEWLRLTRKIKWKKYLHRRRK